MHNIHKLPSGIMVKCMVYKDNPDGHNVIFFIRWGRVWHNTIIISKKRILRREKFIYEPSWLGIPLALRSYAARDGSETQEPVQEQWARNDRVIEDINELGLEWRDRIK